MTTRLILIFITLLTFALTLPAKRQRTSLPVKTETVGDKTGRRAQGYTCDTNDITVYSDSTLPSISDIVRLSGYDKPATASRETLHLTNLSDSLTITSIKLHLQYLDTQGRELHQREIEIYQPISPGHTELISFPTWDIQRSFHYIRSPKPRRQSTPYDIRCTPMQVACSM